MKDWEIKAYHYSFGKHFSQLDDSGKRYFQTHILQVVNILKQVTEDPEIISAAYLHDTLEDTTATYEDLVDNFGVRIADLVVELTKNKNEHDFPNLHSKKAILVKFADRLSNLSRMECWNEERQQRYLKKSMFWKPSSLL